MNEVELNGRVYRVCKETEVVLVRVRRGRQTFWRRLKDQGPIFMQLLGKTR